MTFLIVAIISAILGTAGENPVYVELVRHGLAVNRSGAARLKLPEPTMPDGLSAAAQQRIIEQIAQRHRPQDLLRDSIVAPFVFHIDDVSAGDATDPMRRVDVYYIAYGRLETCFEEAFFRQLVGLASDRQYQEVPEGTTVLEAGQLQSRRLQVAAGDVDVRERYCHVARAMFDRVFVRATYRVVATRNDESIVVATMIDSSFLSDPEFPNQWQPITRDMQGRLSLGPPEPYTVSGAYIKITRLAEPAGALLVEHHQLFAEPIGWFGGKNLLRSKLPLAIQDSVRKFRRQLRTASKEG